MGRSYKITLHLFKFGGHSHCGSGDKMVLVCQVISQDHVTSRHSNIIGRSHSKLFTIQSSLVAIDTVAVEF